MRRDEHLPRPHARPTLLAYGIYRIARGLPRFAAVVDSAA